MRIKCQGNNLELTCACLTCVCSRCSGCCWGGPWPRTPGLGSCSKSQGQADHAPEPLSATPPAWSNPCMSQTHNTGTEAQELSVSRHLRCTNLNLNVIHCCCFVSVETVGMNKIIQQIILFQRKNRQKILINCRYWYYFQVCFKLVLVHIREQANDGLDNKYDDKQNCKLNGYKKN